MRNSLFLLLSTLALLACGTPDQSAQPSGAAAPADTHAQADKGVQSETQRLNQWFEKTYEEELLYSPIELTFLGRDELQNQIDDFSIESMDAEMARTRAHLKELRQSFDYDKLTPEGQTSYDIWVYQAEQALAANAFRTNRYVFEQMRAIHGFFPQLLIAFHKVEDHEDMRNYIQRISESARAIKQLVGLSKLVAEGGVRPPYFAYESVIDESRKIISGQPFDDSDEDSALWADVQSKVATLLEQEAIDEKQAEALKTAARKALVEDLQPAYASLIAWQIEDQAKAGDSAQGVTALPNGEAYYNERLANQTTTDLTADEIHEIGLAEVARLRAEMEEIQQDFGFEGSLQEFFSYLRETKDDRRLYYPDTDAGRQAYIDDATAAIDLVTEKLPQYFGIMPKAELVVKRVEPFREQPGAAQHYYPGTPDGSRPGTYYAHLSDMTAMPKSELEVIAYHEGNPGHHMQISIAQELENLPTFRTQAGFTAYAEGWALYSEWLATEIPGTYETPISNFGRVGSEMWRAIRLVLDTGLHAKGWSEEKAVQYFLANSAITEAQARSEVRRYLVLPGQATSYKIGMLKIQELRRRAEEALGENFDIRAFHDTVLGGGAMPLAILERRVEQWIAKEQATKA
nr:DUF885 domain-containing protein [Oceanococcus sp. HetDA_MAG_MS8]